jgi:phenylpropionate dioxygenase-like ring-hydroxylating dioxygenase large terminal subunit
VIENLLDVAHLGFVHAGLLGDPQRGEMEDYEVTPAPLGKRPGSAARFASGSPIPTAPARLRW